MKTIKSKKGEKEKKSKYVGSYFNDFKTYGIFEVINGKVSEDIFKALGQKLYFMRKSSAMYFIITKLKKMYPEKQFEIIQLKHTGSIRKVKMEKKEE